MTAQLGHSLDLYLASVERPPTCVSADGGLVFDAGERLHIHAAMLPDGRVELFAGAGYVRAELLQAIVEADEDDDFDDDEPRHVADIVARWTGEGAHWAVDVHRETGLLTLSMLVPALPTIRTNGPECWMHSGEPPSRGPPASIPSRPIRCRTPASGRPRSARAHFCAVELSRS